MSDQPAISAEEMAGIVQRRIHAQLPVTDHLNGNAFEMLAPTTGQRFRVSVSKIPAWGAREDAELAGNVSGPRYGEPVSEDSEILGSIRMVFPRQAEIGTNPESDAHRLRTLHHILYSGDEGTPASKHQARRGDEIEAWIKRTRDVYARADECWHAIDGLLDDYRLHADTGTPLSGEVEQR